MKNKANHMSKEQEALARMKKEAKATMEAMIESDKEIGKALESFFEMITQESSKKDEYTKGIMEADEKMKEANELAVKAKKPMPSGEARILEESACKLMLEASIKELTAQIKQCEEYEERLRKTDDHKSQLLMLTYIRKSLETSRLTYKINQLQLEIQKLSKACDTDEISESHFLA